MRMSKNQKELKKKISEKIGCTVTPEDIYKHTDFFKEKEQQKKITYKLAFSLVTILFLISLTFTVVLSVQNYKLKTKEPEVVYVEKYFHIIDDTNGMPEEEKNRLMIENDFFDDHPFSANKHNNKIIIYIYYGYNLDEKGNRIYQYYYAFNEFDYSDKMIRLTINNEDLYINQDNRYGLLTTINEATTSDFTLSFTIETEDRICEYILKNCDF